MIYNKQIIENIMISIEILTEIRFLLSQTAKLQVIAAFARRSFGISKKDISMFLSRRLMQPIEKLIQNAFDRYDSPEESLKVDLGNSQTFWRPNQSKKFQWISVCIEYVISSKKNHQNFSDMKFLQWLFPTKDSLFLEYNCILLAREEKIDRQKWPIEELQLFHHIFKDLSFKGKWGEVAFALFRDSNKKYFRTPQQCREKWNNSLNPNVLHRKWHISEDQMLITLILQHGKKWASISKAMGGSRTEHMVKNRFKSLVRNYESKNQRYSLDKMLRIILKSLQIQIKHGRKIETIQKKMDINEEKTGEQSYEVVECHDQKFSGNCDTIEVEPLLGIADEWRFLQDEKEDYASILSIEDSDDQFSCQRVPYFRKRLLLFDCNFAGMRSSSPTINY